MSLSKTAKSVASHFAPSADSSRTVISTKYWLTTLSSFPRKKCGQVDWLSHMSVAVEWDVKHQTNKIKLA